MIKRSSFLAFLLVICMMTVMLPVDGITAFAASRKTIGKVTIELNLDLTPGESLPDLDAGAKGGGTNVEASSDHYYADEASWVSSSNKDVKIGSTYTLKVYLTAVDPDVYGFQGTYKASNVTVKGGTFVSASRKSYDTLIITIKTKPVKGEFEAPSEADWKEKQLGVATWDKVDNVDAYDVTLYKGSSAIYKVKAFKGNRMELYPYMTTAGTYSFKVRSVAVNDEQADYAKNSEWIESGEIYIAKEAVSDGSGKVDYNNVGSGQGGTPGGVTTGQVGWIQDASKWYYRYPDGSIQKNSWLKVNEKWYLFDSEGWMMTGWQQKGAYWYYLDVSGAMKMGWLQAANGWYFLNISDDSMAGAMWSNQWLDWNGKRFFLSATGVMAEGWQSIGGNWYYFYPGDGSMARDTYISTFYLGTDGIWRK